MSNKIDKSLILNKIKSKYNIVKDSDFAKFLGIAPTTLSSWHTRNTFDIDILLSKCVGLSLDDVFGLKKYTQNEYKEDSIFNENVQIYGKTNNIEKGIPLIPVEAMAGFTNGDCQVLEHECERFIVPSFRGADFLINVRGSSMSPKYSSGDIVACRKLALDTFFQWNKVYVLDTIQGPLIKRVDEGKDSDHLKIISDNPKYKPFEIHRSEIRSLAIVIGVIREE